MPKSGSFGEIREAAADKVFAVPALANGFVLGDELSVILASFLVTSLAASGETHMLGGDK